MAPDNLATSDVNLHLSAKMAKRPKSIDDRVEQLRPPIIRAQGETPTERQLVKLSERSFLDLWSYPNLYRDQKLAGGTDGKELCDLLVVCDPHIIIFSEKNIKWSDKPLDVAWSRWFKKAVKNSVDQINGAERWISEFPNRVFLDRACSQPLPLDLPPIEHRIVHKIAVARGAGAACRMYFSGGTGSFAIKPEIKGSQHWDTNAGKLQPFVIGDVDPEGSFVHIFDDGSLEVVMRELDTITDFTAYLSRKAEFIRSGRLVLGHGEEDLLAYYAVRTNESGDHEFVPPDGGSWVDGARIAIDGSHYPELIQNPQYIAKKEADRVSYLWDTIIKNFTQHMLDGTSIVIGDFEYNIKNSEVAARYMALEHRFRRRSHGEAIQGAMRKGMEVDRFFRAMIPLEHSKDNETGFFFLSLKYLDWMEEIGGYEHYRKKRIELMTAYAQGMLLKYRYLKRVVGIGAEPPKQGRGSSEDLLCAQQTDWNETDEQEILELCEELGIMKPGYVERPYQGQEFPEVEQEQPILIPGRNRKERRQNLAELKRRIRKGRLTKQ